MPSKRRGGRRTIEDQVLYLLSNSRLTLPAADIARQTGVKLSSLSGVLKRLCDSGKLRRDRGVGKRGGYGYRVPGVFEGIMDRMHEQMVREATERLQHLMDQQVLSDMRAVLKKIP